MAVLFGIGSALFLIAALVSLFSAADWIGVAFVCGSVFFTSAAAVQLIASLEVALRGRPHGERQPLRPRLASGAGRFPQRGGTVPRDDLLQRQHDRRPRSDADDSPVERPRLGPGRDRLRALPDLERGCVRERRASLALLAAARDLDWWIPCLNLAGSLAFGLSAIASFERPATGTGVADQLANAGTALGAACFRAGAILLVPQAERQERRRDAQSS